MIGLNDGRIVYDGGVDDLTEDALAAIYRRAASEHETVISDR